MNKNQSNQVNQPGNTSTTPVEQRTLADNHTEELMKVATISDRTRKLLIAKGKLIDISTAIVEALEDMYGTSAADEHLNELDFWVKLIALDGIIGDYLLESIAVNYGLNDFKTI